MSASDETARDETAGTKAAPRGAASSYGLNAGPAAGLPGGEILRAGMQLNDVYEIDALLARGGMGEVYRGHSIQTGDAVAIKVIRADLAENEVAIALFRNEASKLYRLHHEAIIRYFVFSVDPALQRTYLAMEFVEGEPLSQILRRGPMSPQKVRRLAQRVALGLCAAHKREIIHRDVSPDNIIIQNDDVEEAKIIDFGIARSTQAGTTLIDIGFAGKLNYVSPEQLGLYGGDVGPRSDIYSLGIVLAEALRGQTLDMGGTQVEVIDKRKALPSLAGVNPALKPAIAKMLQPDPAARQQTMQEVADDFARIELPESTPFAAAARPDEAPRRMALGAGARARRGPPLLLAAGLLGVGALIGAAAWLLSPQAPAPRPPEPTLHPTSGPQPDLREAPLSPAPESPAPASQAPTPESASPEPSAPAAASSVSREDALAFAQRYDGGPCFAILSVDATPSSTKIEGIGSARGAFDALDAAFRRAIGLEPDIKAVLAPLAECPALDFFKTAKANAALTPDVALDTPFLRAGDPLTGTISGSRERRIEALLIDDDGMAQSPVGGASARLRNFSFAAPPPKTAGAPQLLMFVSSAAPVAALQLAKPAKAAQVLAAAESEASGRHDPLGVSLHYFYVTE